MRPRFFLGNAWFNAMPQHDKSQAMTKTPSLQNRSVSPERVKAVVTGVLGFNLVFLVLFAGSSAACGIFSFIDGGNLSNRKRNALMAGMIASIGAAITSGMSIGQIATRHHHAFQYVDQPWFVPLVVSALAVPPAIVCGMRYLIRDGEDEMPHPILPANFNNPPERHLLVFAGSLAIFGVAFPWLGTSAVSWIPGPSK